MVLFHGDSAHLSITIDGFEGQIVDLSQEGTPIPMAVDLKHAFYDLRTDEDLYNGVGGRTTHNLVAVLDDSAGSHTSVACTFDVVFYP